MRRRLLANLMVTFAVSTAAYAAPPIDLELATERGMQITAPQEWLQLMAGLGIENVRIRAAVAGDAPKVENRGSADRPQFYVVGVLTARDELQLPGGVFHASDRQRLANYFARLSAEGAESMTAPRGRFGLTEREFAVVRADLAQPVDFTTKGQSLHAVLDRLRAKFNLRIAVEGATNNLLRTAAPVVDEIDDLTAGTGLVIILRSYGLALRPEKSQRQPVTLGIVPVDSVDDSWPVGWEPAAAPRETAPTLFEFLNVEIEGYTLDEALTAIAPRIKIPLFWDHAALEKHKIDPATIQVHLPRTRIFYKRLIDRVLAQARLAGQLRVDEAGTAFLWITK